MITKVISGGQTGADMGGLLGAHDAGVPTSGYAPKNFLTENGSNPALKLLGLTDSGLDYVGRTELNVKDSDVTLWFGEADYRGYAATLRECKKYQKLFLPCAGLPVSEICSMIRPINPSVINIAGSRGSIAPGIEGEVRKKVKDILDMMNKK